MDVAQEVQAWASENWDPDRPLVAWRGLLADSGWGRPAWPTDWYGRGLGDADATMASDTLARHGAVGLAGGAGMNMVAPTILAHGSDRLKSSFLRPTMTGQLRWCQLFSEPSSGSDLAGLTTRAELDGDEWVINGQKVWTTSAASADYGLLLARTDWDVPKHAGLTMFLVPMRQAGIECRPLRQMNHYSSFNEVFLTDARVADDLVVGAIGEGWRVAATTLAFERHAAAMLRAPSRSTSFGRCAEEAAAEAAEYGETYRWYPQRAGRVDLLRIAHSTDPVTRQLIARAITEDSVARWTAARATASRREGRVGPEGSLAKLAGSRVARSAAAAHARLRGMDAITEGTVTCEILLSVPAMSIAGGTDEIQHKIVAERVLGLPREATEGADRPFRSIRRN